MSVGAATCCNVVITLCTTHTETLIDEPQRLDNGGAIHRNALRTYSDANMKDTPPIIMQVACQGSE